MLLSACSTWPVEEFDVVERKFLIKEYITLLPVLVVIPFYNFSYEEWVAKEPMGFEFDPQLSFRRTCPW